MQAVSWPAAERLPDGYTIDVERTGMVSKAHILSETGALAASGFAAETDGVFIYDRIVTEPRHRRRGLARALVHTLHGTRSDPRTTEVLVATTLGQALYLTLGWQTVSPYSTASLPPL